MNKKRLILSYIAFLCLMFIVSACSELKEDLVTENVTLTYHGPGINNPSAPDFHGNLIRNNNWRMQECHQCHGADYNGGITNESCRNCHTASRGPEQCNTCHGSFADSTHSAPPEGVNNNFSSDDRGVGAHTKHLYANTMSVVRCGHCHIRPSDVYVPGHIDSINQDPADVTLRSLAIANIATNAVYTPSTSTCANTYCHGNFAFNRDSAAANRKFAYTAQFMTGNNLPVKWTDKDVARCGSCHGLPPAGHMIVPTNQCAACHGTVVDAELNIKDSSKHINGVVNYGTD